MRPRTAAGLAAGCLAVGLGLVLVGHLDRAAGESTGRPATVAAVDWGSSPDPAPSPRPAAYGPSGSAAQARSAAAAINPRTGAVRLTIARLGIVAPVTPVTTTGNELQVPLNPRVLGWWSASAVPGSDRGAVVVDGHINYSGVTGALAVLPQTRAGDVVTISQGATTLRYVIEAVRTYPKASGLPADVFRTTGPPELNLITCGGPFDATTRNYEDNIVAFAIPAGAA